MRSSIQRLAGIILKGLLPAALTLGSAACGPVGSGPESQTPAWPPLAKKWYDRANESFRHADVADAELAIENALRIDPEREEIKLLAAQVALSKLEYERAIELLKGLKSPESRQIRGRALWYSGKLNAAADELESLLSDPEVRDEWAVAISKLARRGAGRKPFELRGLLGYGEMPRVASNNPSLIIPLEINGDPALGLVHTGYAETVVDGSGDPTWVSLRFQSTINPAASALEVKDVPALTKDLSGISRELNAPIKVLLGVNLLRHIHPTFDVAAGQYVVRSFEPPPPPSATTVRINYLRGGGMVLRSPLGPGEEAPIAALLLDTSMTFPIALSNPGWKKAGVELTSLQGVPNAPQLKQGTLPYLQVGAFQFPEVTAVYLEDEQADLEIELDGQVGSGLLAPFRVTLFDGGRAMWLEDHPSQNSPTAPPQQGEGQGKGAPQQGAEPKPGDPKAGQADPKAGKAPKGPAAPEEKAPNPKQ